MNYISALSSDAAFAPYSSPSDLGWLTSSWLLARAFLIDNQHPLSLPLTLASVSMCLDCQTHINHGVRPSLLLAPAVWGSVSSISVCEPVSLSSPGLLLVLEAENQEPALGKAKGKARKESWYRFCWWSGKKLKQVTGVLSDQWCPCSFSTLHLQKMCLKWAWAECQWCWGSSCANGHCAFLCSVPGELRLTPQFPAAPGRALLHSWRGCFNLGQVITREGMSGALLLVKLPKGPWEIPFSCWIWAMLWGSILFQGSGRTSPRVQKRGGSGKWLCLILCAHSPSPQNDRFTETRKIVFAFWKCSCVDRAAENSSHSALVPPQAMFCQILVSLQKFWLSHCYDKRQKKKILIARNIGDFHWICFHSLLLTLKLTSTFAVN